MKRGKAAPVISPGAPRAQGRGGMNEFILQNKLKVEFSSFISILGASSPLFICVSVGGVCFAFFFLFFFFRVNERLRAALESAKIAALDADKLFGGGRLRRRVDDAFCCRGRACLQTVTGAQSLFGFSLHERLWKVYTKEEWVTVRELPV